MAKILNFPATGKPVVDFRQALMSTVPIIGHGIFILRHAAEGKGLKLTANRTLNRAFVQKFWDENVRPGEVHPFKPYKHDDCPELIKATFLLEELRLVRIVRGHLQASKDGVTLLEASDVTGLFKDMIDAYINRWNWACEDRYPEFDFIQDSALDLITALIDWPEREISPRDLFHFAFEPRGMKGEPEGLAFRSAEKRATSCLRVRFFDRFAVPFGLLVAPSSDPFGDSLTAAYEKTDLLQYWLEPMLPALDPGGR